jgi:hypothetical protein
MMDGRSPRIHQCLTIWTMLLIGLVLVEIRHLPPVLTVSLVPYLAFMARHWIGCLRKREQVEPAMLIDEAAGSPSDNEPDECAVSPGSDGRSGYDDSSQPASPRPTEELAVPPSRRGRARRRSKAPEAESLAASWVQVGPGRFVRVEERPLEQTADESDGDSRPDDPHGTTPSDELGALLAADSIPADADADVSESEDEVNHIGQDATEAIAGDLQAPVAIIRGYCSLHKELNFSA